MFVYMRVLNGYSYQYKMDVYTRMTFNKNILNNLLQNKSKTLWPKLMEKKV